MLPQAHGGFHVDEAGVFAELPVHVVGDPPLPVIGINHFLEETRLQLDVVLLVPLPPGPLHVLNTLLL